MEIRESDPTRGYELLRRSFLQDMYACYVCLRRREFEELRHG